MDELRLVRRDEQSLIVANEAGEEFSLLVDDAVLAELRNLSRQTRGGVRVSPRQIQTLVRAGKSREEISALTGADDDDIERYEEPVLAERRFILSSAQAVAVRATPSEGSEQQFGAVIAERLIGLDAKRIEWSSWRDEEAGWMIGLDFEARDVSHRAVWSFDHRRSLLAPITPDAVTLSKQGDVGDRLIPKLRAVDASDVRDRFDSDAFNPEQLTAEFDGADEQGDDSSPPSAPAASPGTEAAIKAGHPSTASIPIPVVDPDAEFARRREIDQRAIKTPQPELPDLGQTADLLDALRRRRGERDDPPQEGAPLLVTPFPGSESAEPVRLRPEEGSDTAEAPRLAPAPDPEAQPERQDDATPGEAAPDRGKRGGKGRASIPSWDDILFGTRSEEDPS